MDLNDLLEYIVPIIFFVVWAIAKALSSKGDNGDESGQSQESPFGNGNEASYETLFGPVVEPKAKPVEREVQPITEEERLAIQRAQEAIAQINSLNKQPAAIKMSNPFPEVKKAASSDLSKNSIHSLLRTPDVSKKAILLYEILGTPVALRDQGKMGQLWRDF